MNENHNQHRSPKKILIVEDNPTTRTVLSRMVRELGCLPITADSGEVAKSRLALNQFDLCLLDLNLPDTTGKRLCRYIRARTTVPLIVLSAEDDADVIVDLLDSGADDYIVKPANFSVIKVTILAQMRRASIIKPAPQKIDAHDPHFQLSLYNSKLIRKPWLH